jgi:hypothetical protein
MNMDDEFKRGNAFLEGSDSKDWFIGHWLPKNSIKHDPRLEVKLSEHKESYQNMSKEMDGKAHKDCTTLTMLISGRFTQIMPGAKPKERKEVKLRNMGDYVMWGPGVDHGWRAEEEGTIMLTIRWPSIDRDKVR